MSDIFYGAYTDGACKKSKIGGWGWVAFSTSLEVDDAPVFQFSSHGGLKRTTNNEMELTAMKEFLKFCPEGCETLIHSDSMYVLGGIIGQKKGPVSFDVKGDGWLRKWTGGNVWRLSSNVVPRGYWSGRSKAPENEQLWYEIYQLLLKHVASGTRLRFCWVKGHSNDPGNDEADRLANIFPLKNGC